LWLIAISLGREQNRRMERSVEIVVAGEVQGVAFRWQASSEAERLGVMGWVRNEPDGTVRCHAEGPAEAVAAFVDWCRRGTRWASVQRVDVTDVKHGGYGSFEISG
jgi:acylphosphatase